MEELFFQIESSDEFEKAWIPDSVEELLKKYGEILNTDLSECLDWFSESVSPHDPDDILSSPVTFEQFKRRLGNYFLFKAHEQQPEQSVTVSDFIVQKRQSVADARTRKTEESNESSQNSNKDASGNSGENLQTERAEEDTDQNKSGEDHSNKSGKNLEEKEQNDTVSHDDTAFKPPSSDRLPEKYIANDEENNKKNHNINTEKPWISVHLKANKKEIRAKFKEYSNAEGNLEGSFFRKVLNEIINICDLSVPESSTKDFRSKTPASFSEFMTKIEQWAATHQDLSNTFKNMIAKTILEYKELEKSISEPYTSHAKSLNESLQDLSSRLQSHSARLDASKIRDIFSFYARAQKNFGVKATFEQIETNNSTWNMSKFLKFCSDFEITPKVPKESLCKIFKKNAIHTLNMGLEQFESSLEAIAEEYFHEPCSKHKLLALLKTSKMKGFGLAFYREKDNFRIPPNDPSRKYNYKISQTKKRELEEWRRMHSEKKLNPVQSVGTIKKDPKFASSTLQRGYSNKLKSGTSKPLTFHDLSKVSFSDTGLAALANKGDEETEAYLKKFYGNQDGYSKILRVQDKMLARGKRVVEKLY